MNCSPNMFEITSRYSFHCIRLAPNHHVYHRRRNKSVPVAIKLCRLIIFILYIMQMSAHESKHHDTHSQHDQEKMKLIVKKRREEKSISGAYTFCKTIVIISHSFPFTLYKRAFPFAFSRILHYVSHLQSYSQSVERHATTANTHRRAPRTHTVTTTVQICTRIIRPWQTQT